MLRAVSKLTRPGQISDRCGSVGNNLQRIRHTRLGEGAMHEERVVVFVFRVQDGSQGHQFVFASASSRWNVLPRLSSDFKPTLPPMRSAAFRTTERPMPVPSYARSS